MVGKCRDLIDYIFQNFTFVNEKTSSLLKSLKFTNSYDKSIVFKKVPVETPPLILTEYFVDVVARGPVPDSTITHNVRKFYNLSDEFHDLSYYVENMEEAFI